MSCLLISSEIRLVQEEEGKEEEEEEEEAVVVVMVWYWVVWLFPMRLWDELSIDF